MTEKNKDELQKLIQTGNKISNQLSIIEKKLGSIIFRDKYLRIMLVGVFILMIINLVLFLSTDL